MEPTQTTSKKPLIAIAFVIIVIVAIALIALFGGRNESPLVGDEPLGEVNDNIIVEQLPEVDGVKTVPTALPEGLPLGTAITESYSITYEDQGVTQHSVTFISESSLESLVSQYETFMSEAGFNVTPNVEDNFAALYGVTSTADLSVVISSQSQGNQVQISYLQR